MDSLTYIWHFDLYDQYLVLAKSAIGIIVSNRNWTQNLTIWTTSGLDMEHLICRAMMTLNWIWVGNSNAIVITKYKWAIWFFIKCLVKSCIQKTSYPVVPRPLDYQSGMILTAPLKHGGRGEEGEKWVSYWYFLRLSVFQVPPISTTETKKNSIQGI